MWEDRGMRSKMHRISSSLVVGDRMRMIPSNGIMRCGNGFSVGCGSTQATASSTVCVVPSARNQTTNVNQYGCGDSFLQYSGCFTVSSTYYVAAIDFYTQESTYWTSFGSNFLNNPSTIHGPTATSPSLYIGGVDWGDLLPAPFQVTITSVDCPPS